MGKLLSVKEAAERFGCSADLVYSPCNAKRQPGGQVTCEAGRSQDGRVREPGPAIQESGRPKEVGAESALKRREGARSVQKGRWWSGFSRFGDELSPK
jgi:hypothetical protein